jgi:YgiT-type zinc finger domain-containing protein
MVIRKDKKRLTMIKKCNFCGNINFKITNTQYIYRHNDRFLVVNNVPCEECEFCGEQYFEANVLKKIEKDYNDIYISGKTSARQITVPVEEYINI